MYLRLLPKVVPKLLIHGEVMDSSAGSFLQLPPLSLRTPLLVGLVSGGNELVALAMLRTDCWLRDTDVSCCEVKRE